MSILRSVDGSWSSKRAMGILYLVALLILFVYKEVRDMIIQNPEIFIGMVLTGGGLLGISLFEYFGKTKKGNIQVQGTVDPTKPGGPKT